MIEIDLFTSEKDGKGEFLGLYKVNVGEIVGRGEVDTWYTLQKRSKKSNVSGKLHLRILYTVVDKQDAYINIRGIRDVKVKSMMYVKVKFGSGKTKTGARQSTPEETPSIDFSEDEALVLPFDETESSIKFYLIDQNNRRSKLGVAQVLVSDLKRDEITELTAVFVSTKKKDVVVGEMELKVSIGDDLKAMEEAARASQAAMDKKKRKKDKRDKRSSKKKSKSKSGADESESEFDDDSEMSDSMTESEFYSDTDDEESSDAFESPRHRSSSGSRKSVDSRKSIDGRKSVGDRKNSSEFVSSSNGGWQTKEDLWPDQEDEDSYMSRLPSNFKPGGRVLLDIREARNLVGGGGGRKDVVFVAKCDYQVYTSSCIRSTQNPVWNEICSFRVNSTNSKVTIGLKDEKEVNPTLGQVTLDIFQFEAEPLSDWFHLRQASAKYSDPVSGDVFVTATFIPYTDNPYARTTFKNLGIPPSPRGIGSIDSPRGVVGNPAAKIPDSPRGSDFDSAMSGTPMGTLTVHILQARELTGKEGQLMSSVKVSLDDGAEKVTPTIKGTIDPVWTVSNIFTFPVYKVKNSELKFTVQDNLRAMEAPGFLGGGSVPLEALAASEERTMERWFVLQRKLRKNRVTGKLRMKLKLELPRQRGDASLFSSDDLVDDATKYDALFKIILIGESGVGKTGLFNRFTTNHFSPGTKATIGSEITCKSFRAEKKIIKVQLWDTAGQERFRSITRQYYRGTMGAILVYDITNKASFDKLHTWIEDVKEYSNNPNLQMLLVGNKVRLKLHIYVYFQISTIPILIYSLVKMVCNHMSNTNYRLLSCEKCIIRHEIGKQSTLVFVNPTLVLHWLICSFLRSYRLIWLLLGQSPSLKARPWRNNTA